jgi:hypothetical protein
LDYYCYKNKKCFFLSPMILSTIWFIASCFHNIYFHIPNFYLHWTEYKTHFLKPEICCSSLYSKWVKMCGSTGGLLPDTDNRFFLLGYFLASINVLQRYFLFDIMHLSTLESFALTASRAMISATPLCCEQGPHILVQCCAINSRFYASYF